jgi:hypothetical protein
MNSWITTERASQDRIPAHVVCNGQQQATGDYSCINIARRCWMHSVRERKNITICSPQFKQRACTCNTSTLDGIGVHTVPLAFNSHPVIIPTEVRYLQPCSFIGISCSAPAAAPLFSCTYADMPSGLPAPMHMISPHSHTDTHQPQLPRCTK